MLVVIEFPADDLQEELFLNFHKEAKRRWRWQAEKTQQLRKESRFSYAFHDEPRKGKGKGKEKGKPSDETTLTPPSSPKTTIKGTDQPSAEGSPMQVDESAPVKSEKRAAGDAGGSPPPKKAKGLSKRIASQVETVSNDGQGDCLRTAVAQCLVLLTGSL